MKKPVLVIMAAGMGSRYGGLKQIDPIDEYGNIIMDFSIYDAKRAGFEEVVFIIKKENEADFRESIGNRMSKIMKVSYVYQELSNLPEGFEVPEGRVKPFGTGHAILSCIDAINGSFAVINADDYYGVHAFQEIYDFLSTHQDDDKYRYTMVAYKVENTLTENGHVARGVCTTDEQNHLVAIHERTHIEKRGDQTEYTEDDGQTWTVIPEGSLVSMNMFGLPAGFVKELEKGFPEFLSGIREGDIKAEYLLPAMIDQAIRNKKATVRVLETRDKWFGVTYKEDKPFVVAAIQSLKDQGLYPQKLWEE